MKLDDFNNLSDEEKQAFLSGQEETEKQITDLTAERDSLKTENDAFRIQSDADQKELKATKELNFTLSRKINVAESQKDDETILYEFMKGFNRR